jgi:hypothetical protein
MTKVHIKADRQDLQLCIDLPWAVAEPDPIQALSVIGQLQETAKGKCKCDTF